MKVKAYVGKAYNVGLPGIEWGAHHDECGWHEYVSFWHSAFWAADHHVRYDCGRREQPSSGTYTLEMSGNLATLSEAQMAEFKRRWAAGVSYGTSPAYTVLNEGGVQNDPTPTCSDDATVELGAITTEMQRVDGEQWGGAKLEGWGTNGEYGGKTGWIRRVWRGR